MRLIDADRLNKKKKYCFQTVGGCFPKSEWFIKGTDLFDAPSVDAVEVVRCKDCKHFDLYGCWICTMHSLKETEDESGANIYMTPDDFCSYGERKEKGDG